MLTNLLPFIRRKKLLSFSYWFNPLPHEHIVKMAVLIEKPRVASSNYYETIKKASILMKLGTNVDRTIASVTACAILNFLLPWQRGDVSKMPKINILPFSHQN
jgi:hypothetical protein